MIEYKRAVLDDDTVNQLIELSIKWVEEDCSFGMRSNTKEDLKEPCYIAIANGKIVGYTFGHYYKKETKTSYIEIGCDCFEVDEIYILPEYRSKGIGRTLFKLIENEAKDKVEYITLATSTKDYKKTLKFYVENNDMVYHSAYLIKKTK